VLREVAVAFEALRGDCGRAADALHWRTGCRCDVNRDYQAGGHAESFPECRVAKEYCEAPGSDTAKLDGNAVRV
jgi:hypothetical protein